MPGFLRLCLLTFLSIGVITAITEDEEQDIEKRISSFDIRSTKGIASGILTKSLKGTSLPDQQGKIKKVEYWLTRLKVSKFSSPRNVISIKRQGSSTILLTAKGITAEITGKFAYKYKSGWVRFSDSGRFTLKIRRLWVKLPLTIKPGSNGKLKIKPGICRSGVASVSIKFRGGLSWIYNLFKGMIERKLDNIIEDQVCKALDKNIGRLADSLQG